VHVGVAFGHGVGIREQRFKLAKYYDASGTLPSQWEM
jgi:hypothetical protein